MKMKISLSSVFIFPFQGPGRVSDDDDDFSFLTAWFLDFLLASSEKLYMFDVQSFHTYLFSVGRCDAMGKQVVKLSRR